MVLKAASNNDKICKNILKDEIKEILNHIRVLLKLSKAQKISLSLAGGLAMSKNYFTNELKRQIKIKFPAVKLKRAKYPPEIGAVILARKLFEVGEINL